MKWTQIAVLTAFFSLLCPVASGQVYTIDVDYPGGNIIVNDREHSSTLYYSLGADTVSLRPDFRDTKKSWFYWNFRVSGAAGRTLHFTFPGNYLGSFGPAISLDGGLSWKWLYKSVSSRSSSFEYSFKADQDDVRFTSLIPYLKADLDKFLSAFKDHPLITTDILTTSEKSRRVEKIMIRDAGSDPKYRVLLAARHHACEAMASYGLEGIIESILNGEDESMLWLRKNVAFFIVPFVDKDGVEDGDQGKNRKPWDHNEDYSKKSIYKSTGAIRKQVPEWAPDGLNFYLDLHCPGLRGKWSETIFTVEAEDRRIAAQQRAFIDILRQENRGPLKLHPERSIIEFGTAWNVSSGNLERMGSREWASEQKGNTMAATLEIAYANNNGQMVTPGNARILGADIAHAIASYMQDLE